MARGDYGPEIKHAIGSSPPGRARTSPRNMAPTPDADPGDTPAEMKRDAARGIKEDSPRDQRLDAASVASSPRMQMQTAGPSNLPPDLHHVAAATSIAHAILGRRPGGM